MRKEAESSEKLRNKQTLRIKTEFKKRIKINYKHIYMELCEISITEHQTK